MRSLEWTLSHPVAVVATLIVMIAGTMGFFVALPKGFMPTQDTGILAVRSITVANVSFAAMERLQRSVTSALLKDPAVEGLASYIGTDDGFPLSNGFITVSLKPLEERKASIDQVIDRMGTDLAGIRGIRLFFKPWQDLQLGVENTASRYQYALIGSDPDELWRWSEVMRHQMLAMPELTHVITTAEASGLEGGLTVDRQRAAAFGVTQVAINNTLYDAFGQRQIATIYLPFNYARITPASPREILVANAAGGKNSPIYNDPTSRGYLCRMVGAQGLEPWTR